MRVQRIRGRESMMPVCRLLGRLACAFLVVAAVAPAGAQTYPDRPIRIIVPIGPGGSYDIVGRLLADHLSKRLASGVTVENRTGAGTVVGTQAAIASPP